MPDGCALLDSEVLSSCAWGLGQVLREKNNMRDWLAMFHEAALVFSEEWREIVAEAMPDAGDDTPVQPSRVVLNHDALEQCLATAVRLTGVAEPLGAVEIWVESVRVSPRKADKPSGHDFLNSFIVDDLHLVAGKAANGDLGAALRDYLRPEAKISIGKRVDVLSRLDVALTATAPAAVPAGRWPSKPAHPLALSQQLAVSTAVGMTGPGCWGLMARLGPGRRRCCATWSPRSWSNGPVGSPRCPRRRRRSLQEARVAHRSV